MAVSWADLRDAFEFVSADAGGNSAYLCRETGGIFWHSDLGDNFEELPEDIGSDKYVAIPNPRDLNLNLGARLVFAFAQETLPGDEERIRKIFSRRGAYGRFKDLLTRRRALDRWYEFESAAKEKALREWCEDNDVEVNG
jgi:hypothetical protein